MLNHKIYDYKIFWKFREKLRYLKLRYNILRFRVSNSYSKEREKLSLGKAYLSEIFINIVRAVLFILFLYVVEFFAQTTVYSNYNNFPHWLKWAVDTIPKPSYPDGRDSVNGYVSFIASVSGLLLALFYPILATIASTGYSNVNSSLRNLLFVEPVTQNYLRELAFLTAYSLLTLLLIIFGYNPGNLVLLILSALALRSLFSLLKLGAGVYNLFEPKTLSKILNKDIVENVKSVTIKSIYWHNIIFQDSFRRESEKKLSVIRLVNELSLEGVEINSQSLIDTTKKSFDLLNVYLTYKSQIPTNSKWFKGQDYHKSYFEIGAEKRQLSISTSTYVLPENKSNLFWFEEEILKIYEDIGAKVLSIENQNIKSDYLTSSLNTLRFLGHSFECDLANKLLTKNLSLTINSFNHKDKSTYDDSKSNLILIEAFLYGIRNFQFNFFERVEALTKEKFNGQISKINWTNKSTVYKLNLPTNLYSFLEKYFENIENERMVEKDRITPDWYIIQHISAEYLLLVDTIVEKIITQIKTLAFPLLDDCKENKNPLALSFASHIILELINKIQFRLPRALNVLKEYDTNNLYKGAYKWTLIDYNKCNATLDVHRNELITLVSNNMFELAMVEWNENYPDVFARSYSIISDEIGKCLFNKDLDGFKNLFGDFLKTSVISFHTLYLNFKDKYNRELEINHQVHLELMQICGVSYLYTKLTGVPFWDEVVKELDKLKWTKEAIRLFAASYLFVQSKLGININWNENQQRQKQLRTLIELENINIEDYRDDIVTYKYLYSSSYHKNDYEEIFMDMYLLTFIESKEWAEKLSSVNKRDLFDMIVRRTKSKDE